VEVRSEDLDRNVADFRRVAPSVCNIYILCKSNRGEMAITQTMKNLVTSIAQLFSDMHWMTATNHVAIERFEVAVEIDIGPSIQGFHVAVVWDQGKVYRMLGGEVC
jgi:hypothetical protein